MQKSVEEIYLWNNSGWKFFLWTNKKEKYNNYINIGGVLSTFWKSERIYSETVYPPPRFYNEHFAVVV